MTLRMEAGAKGKNYKIGQAAKLLDVKPFVLRFWESEFKDVLVPVRTPSGQRAYTEGNVELVREIKRLLYEEGLTIEGAKKRLLQTKGQPKGHAQGQAQGKPVGQAGGQAANQQVQPSLVQSASPSPGVNTLGHGVQPSLLAVIEQQAPASGQPDAQAELLAQSRAENQSLTQAWVQAEDRAEALAHTLSDLCLELKAIRDLLS